MQTSHRVQASFYVVVLVAMLIIAYFIFKPYFSAMFLALILAVVFRSMHDRIFFAMGRHRATSAVLTLGVVVAIILLPIAGVSFLIFQEAESVLQGNQFDFGAVRNVSFYVENAINQFVPFEAEVDFEKMLRQGAAIVVENLGNIFTQIFHVIFLLFIMLLSLFYFFRDGDYFKEKFIWLSPFSDEYDRNIIGRFETAVNSVVRGVIFIAIIQGIVSGIGFWIFGVPNPVLWGTAAGFSALIPFVGTTLVTLPAIIYLLLTKGVLMTIGLVLWSAIAVGLIDNIFGPILMKRSGLEIHPLLILISVLGGIAFFGPVGILAGPIALALLIALFDLFPAVVK
ncbi:MAG: AI-2E family transporter [bacterium]|nr:AI-2E family transporter [bacterium]